VKKKLFSEQGSSSSLLLHKKLSRAFGTGFWVNCMGESVFIFGKPLFIKIVFKTLFELTMEILRDGVLDAEVTFTCYIF